MMVGHLPPDDLARAGIDYHCEVSGPLPGFDSSGPQVHADRYALK